MRVCAWVIYWSIWFLVFVLKQKTAYEMRISDWSSDVCSSDLRGIAAGLVQDPADHAGNGRFAAGARDSDRQHRGVEQRREQLGAAQARRAHLRGGDHVGHRLLDGGRRDDDLLRRGDAAAVLREQRDPAFGERDRKSTRLNSSH